MSVNGWRDPRPGGTRWCSRPVGTSLTELVVALGVATTVAAMSLPHLTAGRDQWRAAAAARYLAAVFQTTRMNAIQRGADIGVRFEPVGGRYGWRVYADGNGNGISSSDIASGIDPGLDARQELPALFPGVDFGAPAGVPQVDSTSPVGSDPIRFGSSDLASFSPEGTSSSGTVYLLSRAGHLWAIRVLGATARVRIVRFDTVRQAWVQP